MSYFWDDKSMDRDIDGYLTFEASLWSKESSETEWVKTTDLPLHNCNETDFKYFSDPSQIQE